MQHPMQQFLTEYRTAVQHLMQQLMPENLIDLQQRLTPVTAPENRL